MTAALVGIASLAGSAARAQDTGAEAAATGLFDEGAKLMDARRYAEACVKFEKSQALAPSGGTLFALAACYAKTGRPTSAWLALRKAAVRADEAGKTEAAAQARERAQKLEAQIAKLTITAPDGIAGLEITRDGAAVPSAEFGVGVPVDPGRHAVEAHAPGRRSFSRSIVARAGDTTLAVAVPDLAKEDAAEAPEPSGRRGDTQRVIALGVGALGVVGLGAGTFFGIRAIADNGDRKDHCNGANACDSTGVQADKDARNAATISTIGFVVGAAALGAGIALYLTAPRDAPAALVVGPSGLAARLRF